MLIDSRRGGLVGDPSVMADTFALSLPAGLQVARTMSHLVVVDKFSFAYLDVDDSRRRFQLASLNFNSS